MALCSWPALLAWISFAFVAARARARFGRPRQRFALRAVGFWFVFALRVLAVRVRIDLIQAGRFGRGFFRFFAPCTLLFPSAVCPSTPSYLTGAACLHLCRGPLLSFPSPLLLFPCSAMANPLDLDVRLEEDDHDNLPFDLNESTLEDHVTYGNVLLLSLFFLYSKQQRVVLFLIFFIFLVRV